MKWVSLGLQLDFLLSGKECSLPAALLVVTAFLLLLSLVCPLFGKSWFCAVASPSHGFVTVKGLSVQRLIGQLDKNVHSAIKYGVNEQMQGGNSWRIQDDCSEEVLFGRKLVFLFTVPE